MGLGLSTYVLIDFVEKIGNTIPVLELILLLMCAQWVIGPYVDYNAPVQHYRYHMYVSEERYMDLIVPSLILFFLPTYYCSSKINYVQAIKRIEAMDGNRLPLLLVVAGFVSELLVRIAPGSIGFVFYLMNGFKFIGVFLLFYTQSRIKWRAFAVVFFFELIVVIRAGVFHELLVWGVWAFIFISIQYKTSFLKKIMILLMGFLMMMVLQFAKADYRKKIWFEGYRGNKLSLFIEIFADQFTNILEGKNELQQIDKDDASVNSRLNQGWIISKIMDNIPSKTPYFEGETVKDAVYSSIMPRFLDDSKLVGGGGKLTFKKLTGLHLTSQTSMGVSVLGEAYGNFGVEGAYVFMFLWGLFLSMFIKYIFNKSTLIYSLPLWLPIIFLQVVKAETDMFTVFNHLVKSTIFVVATLYVIRKTFKINL